MQKWLISEVICSLGQNCVTWLSDGNGVWHWSVLEKFACLVWNKVLIIHILLHCILCNIHIYASKKNPSHVATCPLMFFKKNIDQICPFCASCCGAKEPCLMPTVQRPKFFFLKKPSSSCSLNSSSFPSFYKVCCSLSQRLHEENEKLFDRLTGRAPSTGSSQVDQFFIF